MPKPTAHTIPWAAMALLAAIEPVLVCTAVLKLAPAGAPGASGQQLATALLYALPLALLGPTRRTLDRLLPAEPGRWPMLLVGAVGLCATAITWHTAATTHGTDRAFQFLATALLATTTAHHYAHLAARVITRRTPGTRLVRAITGSIALLALADGGALDHTANALGTICGVTITAAAALWRCLARDITTPPRGMAMAHR